MTNVTQSAEADLHELKFKKGPNFLIGSGYYFFFFLNKWKIMVLFLRRKICIIIIILRPKGFLRVKPDNPGELGFALSDGVGDDSLLHEGGGNAAQHTALSHLTLLLKRS